MGLFSGKKSKEKLLQDFTRSNMSPQLANVAYAKYANNGEIHTAAQALSKDQIEECYQAAFLLFLKEKLFRTNSSNNVFKPQWVDMHLRVLEWVFCSHQLKKYGKNIVIILNISLQRPHG